MGTVVPFEDPADHARVHRRIKRLWEEGEIIVTPYAQRRMTRRRIDLTDIQNIIMEGSVISHNYDERASQWRYRIQGATVAGRTASCVVAIEGRAIIVTVLDY